MDGSRLLSRGFGLRGRTALRILEPMDLGVFSAVEGGGGVLSAVGGKGGESGSERSELPSEREVSGDRDRLRDLRPNHPLRLRLRFFSRRRRCRSSRNC